MSEIQVNLPGQFVTFWIAVAVGAGLCLLYDIFRVLRLARKTKVSAVFVQDILWFFICAIVTYTLMLVRCKGAVRSFALAGEAVGFIACRLTVSKALMLAATPVIKCLSAFVKGVRERIIKPVISFLVKICIKLLKPLKKFPELLKNLLKRAMHLVYNPFKRDKGRARFLKRRNRSESGQTH